MLAKEPRGERYSWVAQQRDLRRVLSTDSIDVYEVIPAGTGRVVARRAVSGLDEAAPSSASSDVLGTEAVVATGTDEGELPSTDADGAAATQPHGVGGGPGVTRVDGHPRGVGRPAGVRVTRRASRRWRAPWPSGWAARQ